MSFNLVDEPWIRVRTHDGTITEVSLRDAFARAADFQGLAGELPTQDFAILRVLLPILMRVVTPKKSADPTAVWEELWKSDELPLDSINTYLDQWKHRFDILDPKVPFMQVADLHTASGKIGNLELLIPDAPTANPLFTMRSTNTAISLAEASRWLIHCQAYDYSGIKSGAVGDPRVKGGRGYPLGIGWCGWLGSLVFEGDNLRETLLLNLYLDIADNDEQDLPIWENPQLSAAPQPSYQAGPFGPLSLYTWQQRRIRLFVNNHQVTQVLIANGDPINYTLQNKHEYMSGWRYSEPQTKKHKRDVFMPRSHDPEKALWRGLSAVLPQSTRDSAATGKSPLPAKTLTWLGTLTDYEIIDQNLLLHTRAIGVTYGAQMSSYSEIFEDTLSFNVFLASATGANAKQTVLDAIDRADAAVQALANLAGNLAIAAGGERDPASSNARASGYQLLDSPFREWLALIDANTDLDSALAQWTKQARTIILGLGADLVKTAGPAAWTGRVRDGTVFSVGQVEVWFRAALNKALPYMANFENSASVTENAVAANPKP